jgi:hypothetical protein
MNFDKIWSTEASEYEPESISDSHLRLKKFNLLIGPNNSGKSRLLRKLFSTPLEKIHVGMDQSFRQAADSLGEIFKAIRANPRFGTTIYTQLLDIYDGKCTPISHIKEQISSFVSSVSQASDPNRDLHGGDLGSYHKIRNIGTKENPHEKLANLTALTNTLSNLKRHYIPILRGMRPLSREADLLLERTIKDYFPNCKRDETNIVTGFGLYDLLVRNLLGQPEDRSKIREYEKILGEEFFGGAEITLIPEYEKDTVSVKIGEDDQFPIYNLGDGLQQVIIITSVAFLERDFSLFFIEEPEACLHPGLLRRLALFLVNHTPHQYISTTHSNHLLDLAENHKEVLIHRVSKTKFDNEKPFEIHECTRDQQLLNDLGVLASSVYLANSTIWVEGITDRLYLKAFMKKYLFSLQESDLIKKYEGYLENFHYAFVEYQGGTLGHWGFDDNEIAERLSASHVCTTALLVADGDILDKGDRAATLSSELGDRLHILPCKEIENILPIEVIRLTSKRIFSRKQSKTTSELSETDLDKIRTRSLENSKTGIGYHLDRCLGLAGKGKSARRVFADESGTINEKVKFCREAIDVMSEADWELNEPIKTLCSLIFSHIEKHN